MHSQALLYFVGMNKKNNWGIERRIGNIHSSNIRLICFKKPASPDVRGGWCVFAIRALQIVDLTPLIFNCNPRIFTNTLFSLSYP